MNTLPAAEGPCPRSLPDHVPAGFDHQIDRVTALTMQAFRVATRDEMLSAARTMGMLAGDRAITSSGESDNARLVEWTAFHIRREGKPLIQVLLDRLPAQAPASDRVILSALVASRWSLFRIEAVRSDVGVVALDVWRRSQRVVFSRTLSQQVRTGDFLMGRLVSVDDLDTLTALVVLVHRPLLDGLRRLQEQGSVPSDAILAHDPVWQEELAAKMFALPPADHPVATVERIGNRARNYPCPCGSGRKFKHCCGRGA